MMKITLFVFAVLLVAVAFARPDEAATTETKPFNLDEITKLLTGAFENAKKEIDSIATKENMEKIQSAWDEGVKKAQETVETLIANANKKD